MLLECPALADLRDEFSPLLAVMARVVWARNQPMVSRYIIAQTDAIPSIQPRWLPGMSKFPSFLPGLYMREAFYMSCQHCQSMSTAFPWSRHSTILQQTVQVLQDGARDPKGADCLQTQCSVTHDTRLTKLVENLAVQCP